MIGELSSGDSRFSWLLFWVSLLPLLWTWLSLSITLVKMMTVDDPWSWCQRLSRGILMSRDWELPFYYHRISWGPGWDSFDLYLYWGWRKLMIGDRHTQGHLKVCWVLMSVSYLLSVVYGVPTSRSCCGLSTYLFVAHVEVFALLLICLPVTLVLVLMGIIHDQY